MTTPPFRKRKRFQQEEAEERQARLAEDTLLEQACLKAVRGTASQKDLRFLAAEARRLGTNSEDLCRTFVRAKRERVIAPPINTSVLDLPFEVGHIFVEDLLLRDPTAVLAACASNTSAARYCEDVRKTFIFGPEPWQRASLSIVDRARLGMLDRANRFGRNQSAAGLASFAQNCFLADMEPFRYPSLPSKRSWIAAGSDDWPTAEHLFGWEYQMLADVLPLGNAALPIQATPVGTDGNIATFRYAALQESPMANIYWDPVMGARLLEMFGVPAPYGSAEWSPWVVLHNYSDRLSSPEGRAALLSAAPWTKTGEKACLRTLAQAGIGIDQVLDVDLFLVVPHPVDAPPSRWTRYENPSPILIGAVVRPPGTSGLDPMVWQYGLDPDAVYSIAIVNDFGSGNFLFQRISPLEQGVQGDVPSRLLWLFSRSRYARNRGPLLESLLPFRIVHERRPAPWNTFTFVDFTFRESGGPWLLEEFLNGLNKWLGEVVVRTGRPVPGTMSSYLITEAIPNDEIVETLNDLGWTYRDEPFLGSNLAALGGNEASSVNILDRIFIRGRDAAGIVRRYSSSRP